MGELLLAPPRTDETESQTDEEHMAEARRLTAEAMKMAAEDPSSIGSDRYNELTEASRRHYQMAGHPIAEES